MFGPSTVREVQDVLESERGTGYTTTLKLMQMMYEKGLVRRNDQQRTHVFGAAVSRVKTQRQLIGDLLERAFDGSASQLVLQALSTRKTTRAEWKEIRELLDQWEGDDR